MENVSLLFREFAVLSTNSRCVLQVGSGPPDQPPIFTSKLDDSLEIISSKKFLITCFVEGHHFLESFSKQYISTGENLQVFISCKSTDEIYQIYKATLAVLIACPEHSTALNIHWDCLKCLGDEFCSSKGIHYVEIMLTSKLSRLNKSSLIWLLYKKLIATLKSPFSNDNAMRIVRTVLDSVEQHPRNYYAWNFLRSYIHLLQVVKADLSALYHTINAYCHSNLSDQSSWEVLLEVIYPNNQYTEFVVQSWNTLAKQKLELTYISPDKDILLRRTEEQWAFVTYDKIINQAPWSFIKSLLDRLKSNRIVNVESKWQLLSDEVDKIPGRFEKGKYITNHAVNFQSSISLAELEEVALARNKARILSLHNHFP